VADTIRLTSIEGGGNWWKVLNWADAALKKAGFETKITRYGDDGMNTVTRVADGTADIAVTLSCAAWMAHEGRGIFKGKKLPVRGLALTMHPGHYFYNFVRTDVGISSFADFAKKKPKLGLCVGNPDFIAGRIAREYMRFYGVDIDKDIPAWGGQLYTSFPEATRLFIEGKANALMRENTKLSPAGIAASICDVTCLSLDREIADRLAAEYGTPVITIPPNTLRGQTQPVLTVGNPGYPIMIHKDMPDDLAYRLAKALNVSSPNHAIAEDIFYSPRHAPDTAAPLHPGAAKYYRELGVAK
jgi:TRAP transporter TAXI family solute receptor